jgi:hypothetical protein
MSIRTPQPYLRRGGVPALLATALLAGALGAQAPSARLSFVENRGQWPAELAFAAATPTLDVRVASARIELSMRGSDAGEEAAVELAFAIATGAPTSVRGEDELPGRHHFFLGTDAQRWRRDVRAFGRVRLEEVVPGIDLVLREGSGAFEYDLVVRDAAALPSFVMRCEGAMGLRLDADGALLVDTARGALRQTPPVSWYERADGTRVPVRSRFAILDARHFGFAVEGLDAASTLVIDPGIEWSSFLGGSSWESAYGAATDGEHALATGQTGSRDFPTTGGAVFPAFSGRAFSDVFVSKIDPNGGSLVFATYLGGGAGEEGRGLAVGPDGSIFVVGVTSSGDFPTTLGAFDRTMGGSGDGFLAKLSPAGDQLLFCTLIGGGSGDVARAVEVESGGTIAVGGTTSSGDFPTTVGAFDRTLGGTGDGFLARFSANGASLLAATLYGGSDGETACKMRVADDGSLWFGGVTSSTDAPTTAGAFDRTLAGSSDAFVAHFAPNLGSLLAATLLGGSSGDTGEGLDLDRSGRPVIGGVTSSADFPTTPGAFDTTLAGTSDAFVARFDVALSTLIASTLIGGGSGDVCKALEVDGHDGAVISGVTSSGDFPTTAGAFSGLAQGASDAFVARLDPSATTLRYASYLGGSNGDLSEGLALDRRSRAILVGTTSSSDFPTTPGVFDPTTQGSSEAFASRDGLLAEGLTRLGAASPACRSACAIDGFGRPSIGNASFAIACSGAPSFAPGNLLLSLSALPAPFPLLGVDLWVNPLSPFFLSLLVGSDALGRSALALPIVGDPQLIGFAVAAQHLWLDACGSSGLSASDALLIVLQQP